MGMAGAGVFSKATVSEPAAKIFPALDHRAPSIPTPGATTLLICCRASEK
jgi:hypothetical protein